MSFSLQKWFLRFFSLISKKAGSATHYGSQRAISSHAIGPRHFWINSRILIYRRFFFQRKCFFGEEISSFRIFLLHQVKLLTYFKKIKKKFRKNSSTDLFASWGHFHHHGSDFDGFSSRRNQPISFWNENSHPRNQTFERSCSYSQNCHRNWASILFCATCVKNRLLDRFSIREL